MKGNEQMIFNKDKVPKYGQMDINIQANIIMEKIIKMRKNAKKKFIF